MPVVWLGFNTRTQARCNHEKTRKYGKSSGGRVNSQ
jgi:hypothetical protein